MGFSWLAQSNVRDDFARRELQPLAEGRVREGWLYLMHADRCAAVPGRIRFCSLLRDIIANQHAQPF